MNHDDQIESILEKYKQGASLTDRNGLCLSLAVLFTMIEAFCILLPLQYYLIVHTSLASLLLVMAVVAKRNQWDTRYYMMLAALFIPMGPMGSGIACVSMMLYTVYLRTKTPLIELIRALYPEEEEDPVDILYERIHTGLEDLNLKTKPIPFQDIMKYGTTAQKRNAIEKVLRFYRPSFASALFLGLSDSENAIRILSATAITCLDSQYMNHFQELQKKVKAQPENPEVLLDFAKHCEVCSNSGILDADRVNKMRMLAIKGYEQFCSMVADDINVYLALGRVYLQNGDAEKAIFWLRKVARGIEVVPIHTLWLLLRAKFATKKYGFIRTVCKKILTDERTSYKEAADFEDYVHFWFEEKPTKGTV